ncbi:MAG: hypothetical protein ABJF11_11980 [Reichenbachiella sp.]|uniref:hypothetical protein n=1 Tax=Reichenbachiella sp. TaxID=2184521 RepID=UPI003265E9BA
MRATLIAILTILSLQSAFAQSRRDEMRETESQLEASTKQINQFFRRFNGEEDEKGKRYYEGDKRYRDPALRRKYTPVLFDAQIARKDPETVKSFIKTVTDKRSPEYLDFHHDDWFAEVQTTFDYNGKRITGTLYMRLQQQGQGYEWIIEDVSFPVFNRWFDKDTTANKKFMHPMSHELGFMPLKKALKDNDHAEQFTAKNYETDFLSIFLFELNQGHLEFVSVKNVSFHFFAIDDYYFALSYFNRPGYNSGWLISGIVELANQDEKQQMKDFIYGKG